MIKAMSHLHDSISITEHLGSIYCLQFMHVTHTWNLQWFTIY